MFCMTDSWLNESLGRLEFSILNIKDLKLKSLFFPRSVPCLPQKHEGGGKEIRRRKENGDTYPTSC